MPAAPGCTCPQAAAAGTARTDRQGWLAGWLAISIASPSSGRNNSSSASNFTLERSLASALPPDAGSAVGATTEPPMFTAMEMPFIREAGRRGLDPE